jgi:hypothetical protein
VARQDIQVLRVYRDSQEPLRIQERQDLQDSQDGLDPLVNKDHKALLDLPVQQVLQELLRIQVQQELLDYKVLQVLEMQVEVQ